jgi:hypothetical protein
MRFIYIVARTNAFQFAGERVGKGEKERQGSKVQTCLPAGRGSEVHGLEEKGRTAGEQT